MRASRAKGRRTWALMGPCGRAKGSERTEAQQRRRSDDGWSAATGGFRAFDRTSHCACMTGTAATRVDDGTRGRRTRPRSPDASSAPDSAGRPGSHPRPPSRAAIAPRRSNTAPCRSRPAHSRTTTLPNCAPESSRAKAAAPSSSAHTESTGGCSAPSRKATVIASNSASLPIVEPISVH